MNFSRPFWSCACNREKSGPRRCESSNRHQVQNPLPVLTAYGCRYKSPQTGWLQRTQIFNHTVAEVRNLKGVSGRAAFLQETLMENPFPCLFQLLEATRLPWFLAPPPSEPKVTPHHITPAFLPLSQLPKSPLLPPPSIHKDPCDYIGFILMIQNNLFHLKSSD